LPWGFATRARGPPADPANVSGEENDLFGATVAADGSTWAVGWALDTSTALHAPLVVEGVNGSWSLVPTPSLGNSDSGLEAIAAIPGGGMWAVSETGAAKGNYSTLIEYHP